MGDGDLPSLDFERLWTFNHMSFFDHPPWKKHAIRLPHERKPLTTSTHETTLMNPSTPATNASLRNFIASSMQISDFWGASTIKHCWITTTIASWTFRKSRVQPRRGNFAFGTSNNHGSTVAHVAGLCENGSSTCLSHQGEPQIGVSTNSQHVFPPLSCLVIFWKGQPRWAVTANKQQ